jgi:tRNA A-37 threonylcarbamoyl transferase component Bud32
MRDIVHFLNKTRPLDTTSASDGKGEGVGRSAAWGDFDVHFEQVLGRGGMGTVYRAWQRSVGRWTAVKAMDAARAEDADLQQGFLEKFRIEIRALAKLKDPRIVTLFAAGCDEDRLWYAMELIDGETVDQRLGRDGAFAEEEAARVGAEVGRALAAAWREGIVHRDVKPANIFLLRDGSVKLADFGLARGTEFARTRLTDVDALACTPEYASPEQGEGRTTDHRSDLYSLGCVLYEMLAERPPFTGDSPLGVLHRHATEPVPSARVLNPAVSPELDAVVKRCLEKDPADRWEDYESFIAALEAVREGSRPMPALPPRPGRSRFPKAAAAASLLLAGAAVWLLRGGEESAPPFALAAPVVDLTPPPLPTQAPAPEPPPPAPSAPPPPAVDPEAAERDLSAALAEAEAGRFAPLAALRLPEADRFRSGSEESAAAALLLRGDPGSLVALMVDRSATVAARRAAQQAYAAFRASVDARGHELVGEIPWGTWTPDLADAPGGAAAWDSDTGAYRLEAAGPGDRVWIKRRFGGAREGFEVRFAAESGARLAVALNFSGWIEISADRAEFWGSASERPLAGVRLPAAAVPGASRTLSIVPKSGIVLLFIDGRRVAALREPDARIDEGLQIGAGGGRIRLESLRVRDRDR